MTRRKVKEHEGFVKGAVFELVIISKLLKFEGCETLSRLKIYSFRLERETEIDTLFVAPWGLYCIEAKGFNTALEGNFSDSFWSGWTGRKMTKVYNPVFQNFEHCRALNALVRLSGNRPLPLKNIVVVPDDCVVKTNTNNVMTLSEMVERMTADSCKRNYVNVEGVVSLIKKLGR